MPTAANWCSCDAVDAVLHDGSGMHAAIGDEDGLVDPGVALVAGLQAQCGAEVVVAVVARALAGEGRQCSVGLLDDAEVLDVDARPVVGQQRRAHIEAPEAVVAREDPVGAAGAHLAADALAGDFAADDLEDAAVPEGAGAHRDGRLELCGERELVNQLHGLSLLGMEGHPPRLGTATARTARSAVAVSPKAPGRGPVSGAPGAAAWVPSTRGGSNGPGDVRPVVLAPHRPGGRLSPAAVYLSRRRGHLHRLRARPRRRRSSPATGRHAG